jgi:hypothetical protein
MVWEYTDGILLFDYMYLYTTRLAFHQHIYIYWCNAVYE